MALVDSKDWSEIKQFKDPVYGYIPVSRAYVKSLIDTQMMQRIKGVAQTGLRPVFSSATHDRFSHSLGVYKFSMAMYESFSEKLLTYVNQTYLPKCTTLDEGERNNVLLCLRFYLKHWKTLLAIASLLHDIGHPVQSHGFEFLYDDPYLDMEYDRSEPVVIGEKMNQRERERVYQIFRRVSPESEKKPKGNLDEALLNAFHDRQDFQDGTVSGNCHEKMSAYYILKDENLGNNITELIEASWHRAISESNLRLQDIPTQPNPNSDFCFIARMIIGWEYPAEAQLSFHKTEFFNSVKNCVIHILNGSIDADGIDYLMRNSYAAGYDTSKVDSTRLCNAYTAYEKNHIMFPAFSKSALSVLEGFMAARDFEPKWLYSHHKVVYADLLTKQLYKYITRYLTDRTMLLQAVKLFLKHAEKSALVVREAQDFGTDFLFSDDNGLIGLSANTLHSHIEQWSYPFYTYLLAPCRRYSICSQYFSQTADADLENLFHWMLNELAQYDGKTSEERYTQYTQRLRTHVLESVLKDPSVRFTIKQVRILLAETCLYPLNLSDEKIPSILRAWVKTGDVKKACRRLDCLGGHHSDVTAVKTMLHHTAGCDKQMLLGYWLEQYQPLLSPVDFEDFISLLKEYQTRRYRSSLWKSYPEYQLFLNNCAHQLGVSAENVHRYLTALINDGMTEHGISIFDGKAVKYAPNAYRRQFFFRFDKEEDHRVLAHQLAEKRDLSSMPDPKEPQKEIVQRHAAIIFAKTEHCNNLVVRFHSLHFKRFNKVCILFNNQPVPLEEIFPVYKDSDITFPYFYYTLCPDIGPDQVLDAFQKKFIDFCREYRKCEVGRENIQMGNNHTFRDAVYGDIEVPENFYSVICTREFQRLGRIRQLATADRSFPNATHTRLAHSIGTWHVMRLILNHFKQLYASNPQLDFSDAECNCALLAALLHDLGHGPYSHTIEAVFGLNHEDMTQRIIMDPNTEIHYVIEDQFGTDTARQVCELLNGTSSTGYANGIGLIYHAVISGQLDADRIDYLLRDNVACGMAFAHIDIQQLIASMRMLPIYGDKQQSINGYCLCFDERYLPAIDQFIYARYQMYKNVYHDPRKQLFEQLFVRIFRQALALGDEIELSAGSESVFPILKEIYNKHDIAVSKFIWLDDESVNALIKKWAAGAILKKKATDPKTDSRAKIIQSLSKAFLDQSLMFKQIDLGGQHRLYDLLATHIGKQLGVDCNTFIALDEAYSAFIYIQGSDCAYKMFKDKEKNIVLRNLVDGTTTDYAQQTLFRSVHGSTENTILETDYCYLFFSEDLLRADCLMHDISEETAYAVKQSVESATPRKHIEIEQKFYCECKVLETAKKYLNEQYNKAKRTEKAQTDTYYDCKIDGVWLLAKNHFSFRCRERGGKYIFTVKIPTDSPNYHSPSQFARHEHELVTTGPSITDEVWQFLLNTLDICERGDLGKLLSREQMQVQLLIYNQRVTYRIESKCEICLDTVEFKTAFKKPVGDPLYQIEVELLGEPEDWKSLEHDVIDPLVKTIGADNLIYTSKSKLETGLSRIESGTS